ncbi:MFS transporter [Vibrio ulleungensis]|uniref:MFS transporter n=1 Tax=Vibrio ulleungensis TaxID=2807619 RepID=A0ABS2HH15_9VIBR|nr:MFS transporter [Vibrio ulleungensis]MBM7035369.1 MFS transporter [Vibrio ulleungensis]
MTTDSAFPRSAWLLIIVAALTMSTGFTMVFVGGIIGLELAPKAEWATFPLALMITGVALTTLPMGVAISRWGRKPIIVAGAWVAVFGGLLAALSVALQWFWLLCLSAVILGASMAVVQQYRFAVMEWVSPQRRAEAASRVLVGGLVAAFLGPELASFGKDWLSTPYVGSFVLMAIVNGIAAIVLLGLDPTPVPKTNRPDSKMTWGQLVTKRDLVCAVLAGAIGYAVMSFIMTATPLHMHGNVGHSLEHTKWVIQSHIFAMFAPSLFSGWLIRKLGFAAMMVLGIIAFALSIAIALKGDQIELFWGSLVLLGIGWNFLFVSATALLPTTCSPEQAPKVQSMNDFFIFASQAVASLSAGWILHAFGWQTQLWLCAPLLVVLLIAIVRWQTSLQSTAKQTS